jgi:hypothetical protein
MVSTKVTNFGVSAEEVTIPSASGLYYIGKVDNDGKNSDTCYPYL